MIEAVLCWLIKLFTGARARWVGHEFCLNAQEQRVYFANHTSHLDFVLLWAVLPAEVRERTRPVAARDYWTKTAIRKWIAEKIFRAVLIERVKINRENNPIEQLGHALESGDSLIIFPEGTRNTSESLGNFKSGLYHLALQHVKVQFIPVYLENLNRVLPKGEVLAIPLICTVTFGNPIPQVGSSTKTEFLAEAKSAIERLQKL